MVGEAGVDRPNGSTLRTQLHKHSTCQPAVGVRDLGAHGDSNVELNWSGASALWPNGTLAAHLYARLTRIPRSMKPEGRLKTTAPPSGSTDSRHN